jgi:hypothetical protein
VAAARFELYALAQRGTARGRRQLDAPVTWRLLSGNNRDLGRAAAPAADAEACLAALDRLRAALASPAVVVSSPDGRSRWTWRISVDEVDAAVSSRVYQRRVQAEAACAVFLSLAAGAPVAVGVIRLVGSGRAARL